MFEAPDQETLNLIIELQLQDAKALIKGKHRAGEPPDRELAAELFKQELESLASFHADRAMCRSIAQAVLADGEAIQDHVGAEQQVVADRNYALHGESSTGASGTALPDVVIDDEMVKKLAALYVAEDHPDAAAASSSKQIIRAKSSTSASDTRKCVACVTDVPYFDTVRCPCSHEYCRSCLADLFQSTMNDESLFPPRCCGQPIPLGLNQIFLPAKLAGLYRAKELEYTTKDRTYCHVATCSTFVPPSFIRGEVAVCVKCESKTCTICKGSTHNGDCPKDMATLDLLSVAAENGWQRCYSCRSMVDLSTGCNLISKCHRFFRHLPYDHPLTSMILACRCGAQFCYICGVQWKTCSCAQWDEERLVDRANDIVDRDADRREIEAHQRAALVELARNNLVENHDCQVHSWKSRRGSFRCEECHHFLPEFIYECRNCRILACRRCRYNRL